MELAIRLYFEDETVLIRRSEMTSLGNGVWETSLRGVHARWRFEPIGAIRAFVKRVQEETGPDAVILGCSLPPECGADIAPSMRIGDRALLVINWNDVPRTMRVKTGLSAKKLRSRKPFHFEDGELTVSLLPHESFAAVFEN